MQPSRLRSLLGSLVEPFTGRRHAVCMSRLAEIERALKETREALGEAGGLALRVKQLEDKVAGESRNLGMVAGGLEHLRSSVQDVDITRDKFLAYEQALEDIAQRVDELGRAVQLPGERREGRS